MLLVCNLSESTSQQAHLVERLLLNSLSKKLLESFSRPRGTLDTSPELTSQRTTTSETSVDKRTGDCLEMNLLSPKRSKIEKATSEDRVPEWLTKLLEVEPFLFLGEKFSRYLP